MVYENTILLKISTEILLGFNTQKSFVISGTRNVPFLCTPTFRLRFLIQRNVFAFLEPATLLLCSKNST
ncbi:MAG: hypothetical protein KKA06_01735, partial [Nanoarchaeota archaeon]|nr:hypothetical protein [Nanoarchaeota archaeon]